MHSYVGRGDDGEARTYVVVGYLRGPERHKGNGVTCPVGGPNPSTQTCPSGTQCCTCQAEEGWTSGGCMPENETCCGSNSCPDTPNTKCCGPFYQGGNSPTFQCYDATKYVCDGKGNPPRPTNAAERARGALSQRLRTRTARKLKGGLGPELSCDM